MTVIKMMVAKAAGQRSLRIGFEKNQALSTRSGPIPGFHPAAVSGRFSEQCLAGSWPEIEAGKDSEWGAVSNGGKWRAWEVQGPEHSRFFRVSSAAKEELTRLAGKSGPSL